MRAALPLTLAVFAVACVDEIRSPAGAGGDPSGAGSDGNRDIDPGAGPGSGSGQDPGCGAPTILRGVVTFPDGRLPVDGAVVFVPSGPPEAALGGECGECIDSSALSAWAVTGADGSFTLENVPSGPITLVVRKGKFERIAEVDVEACRDRTLDVDVTRLPRNAREGSIPRIAVITGSFDRMEDVLGSLGLERGSFDLFASDPDVAGAREEAGPLLRDAARLSAYDIVFVDCGASIAEVYFGNWALDNAAVRDNLRNFVEGGGRLYVTDLAYDLIEEAFPGVVDFQGGGASGLSESPEAADEAQIGDDLPLVQGVLHDDGLREWLQATGAIDGSGQMPLRGLLGGWTVIDRVDASVRTWVSGSVSWGADPYYRATPGRGDQPLTISFVEGCGRALFTSYHTVPEEAGDGLSAQEQALAYLVLEIGVCILESGNDDTGEDLF